MYPGQLPGLKREESVRLHVNERRLPTPVNHLNTLRPQPPGPPSARALPFTMYRSEVSSGRLSLSATHGYLDYIQSPVSEPSTSWALPTGVQRLLGSTGSMSMSVSVSAPHHSLNSSQPFVSGSSALWATVVPFTHGSAAPVPQPTQGNHSHSAQPLGWGVSASRASDVSHSQGSSVPIPQRVFDYYHHTFPQRSLMSQARRAVKRKAQKLSSPANISHFQNTFRSSSIASGYASSLHDGGSDEHSSSLVGRTTSDTATFTTGSPSPEGELKIIMEDPQNGHLHREKRIRTQEELDDQKEGMRVLKDNGGACQACYKSKKRCGPGDPCPPCAARNRECIRSDRNDGETVSAGGQPTSASAPAQPLSTSSQFVSTSSQSSSSHTEPSSLIDRPSRPEDIPTEMTSNEDPPALGCDLLEDYLDPFLIDPWQDGMNCIDSAYDNVSYHWVGTGANGHLTI
ncbi:uncharacterized protein N7473_002527 [Penicillium subrubescens]|uniref:uncharacterized protein n=1 Tax=Penicillium subrubescens TaxID=1316194 RepID=UPI002545A83C|nr:uncharacterized protein N7473_002527 [Penicillium subrubescens]KAJ5905611.1 hypothetical protein N7473_002527 [Penicillium subrubescens]